MTPPPLDQRDPTVEAFHRLLLASGGGLPGEPEATATRDLQQVVEAMTSRQAPEIPMSLADAATRYSLLRCSAALAARDGENTKAQALKGLADGFVVHLANPDGVLPCSPPWWLAEATSIAVRRVEWGMSQQDKARWEELKAWGDGHVKWAHNLRVRQAKAQARGLDVTAGSGWATKLPEDPVRSYAWIASIVTVTFAGAVYGVGYFPPGSYPRIVLAIPGLIAGAVIYLLGPVFAVMPRALAVCIALGVVTMGVLAVKALFTF